MDSGSEIDFNDLPERASDFESEGSDNEGAANLRGKAISRDSSPSRREESSRDSSPSRKEVGHRSPSPVSHQESSSTDTSASKGVDVTADSMSDSDEADLKDDLDTDLKDEIDTDLKDDIEDEVEDKMGAVKLEDDKVSVDDERSAPPSPSPREESPAPRQQSPPTRAESPAPRDHSLERKSSQASTSSYSDDRANSMSPEPAEPISTPLASHNKDITKIYTEKLVNEKPVGESFADKIVRSKPAGGDITQIYTASLQSQKEQQSPRLERARGGKPVKDITQLYTANLSRPEPQPEVASPNRPRRNDNITKLYTNGFEASKNFKAKPSDEITNPRKHNMSTSADKEGIRDAYAQVMADNNGVEWAVFKFDEANRLIVHGTGEDFPAFRAAFGPDDRGFGYVKIQTGDEMSKRSRFVLVTWVGSNTSVMKKAKMSTDKLIVKDIIQNLSVEITTENGHELSYEHLKSEVDKAGGARYGTGVRVD